MNNILFVCMGNICRSPSAKGFFDLHCQKRGLEAFYQSQSAGTHGWHAGQPPDKRSVREAKIWDVNISCDLSRKVQTEDFHTYHHILAMDRSNLDDLQALSPNSATAKLSLLLSYGDNGKQLDVPDPYFGGADGFDKVCQILNQACSDFLDTLETIRRDPTA